MKREFESQYQPEHPLMWAARDDLFRVFVNELFEGSLSAREIEAARRKKFEGKEIPKLTMMGIAAKIVRHRITSEKQLVKQENLLSRISDDEKQVIEVALGLNACGMALNRNDAANQLNLDVDAVDKFIKSTTAKLHSSQTRQK